MSWPDPVRVVRDDGDIEWVVGDELHRLDGPAYEEVDGGQQWWVEGRLHRLDGPAVVWPEGSEWWVDGEKHRSDGPAYEGREDGISIWYDHGLRHRLDGPAIEYADGTEPGWWLYGVPCPWTTTQAAAFLALTIPAREFVAAHVHDAHPEGTWPTWEALFASAAEATARTVTLPLTASLPPSSRSRGGAL